MNASKYHQLIISKIKATSDTVLLDSVLQLLQMNEDDAYQLSPEELDRVEESRSQIKAGRSFTHDEVMRQAKEWLER